MGARLLVLSCLAFAFIFMGHRLGAFKSFETSLNVIATPFYWLADIPDRLKLWGEDSFVGSETLKRENKQLRSESVLLKAQVQKLASLEAENVRLRALLNSSALLDDTVLVAEIIGVSATPLKHEIVINKGRRDKLYVGQPVIDEAGLMGQVTEVGELHSRVLLITDSSHAIPVQINRNGVRSIAEGVGLLQELTLRHVSATTDIKVGDLLVSSGLGQRFPFGYPVATVTEVTVDPGQPFVLVKAKPSAKLDRSRYVLLVFSYQKQQG